MSRLPPEFGKNPTKLVFRGVDPGSPAARQLFLQYEGQLRHFHAKARQAVGLSELPIYATHIQLPGGGSMHYSYNNGQEAIHVLVNPTTVEVPTTEPVKKTTSPTYVLAIDVVFDLDFYLVKKTIVPSAPTLSSEQYGFAGQMVVGLTMGQDDTIQKALTETGSTNRVDSADISALPNPPQAGTGRDYLTNSPDGTDALPVGFLVHPDLTSNPGPFELSVYIAAQDIYQEVELSNEFTEIRNERSHHPGVRYAVQVREYEIVSTYPEETVGWQITARLYQRFEAGDGSVIENQTTSAGGSGSIFTSPAWAPGSGPYSDPTAEGMGSLLDQTPKQDRDVAGDPDISERDSLLLAPSWTFEEGLDITDATMVATITWAPPAAAASTGSAQITPA